MPVFRRRVKSRERLLRMRARRCSQDRRGSSPTHRSRMRLLMKMRQQISRKKIERQFHNRTEQLSHV
jgi:hypothetical protein